MYPSTNEPNPIWWTWPIPTDNDWNTNYYTNFYYSCPHCGFWYTHWSKFCPNCGKPLQLEPTLEKTLGEIKKLLEEVQKKFDSLQETVKKEGE